MKDLVEEGQWSKNITWRLYESDELPKEILCTAVFCVAIIDYKIVIMRPKRGWGMLGGHIEANETLLKTLSRECREEGGFTPDNPTLFGFREITAKEPVPHQDTSEMYPFPTSYILYYWATTVVELVSPSGVEVLESRAFTIDELRNMNLPDFTTIELGWKSFLK